MPSIRDAALLAGVSADLAVRTRVLHRRPGRIVVGAGVLMAGAVIALAHVVGADMRALTGNQLGMLSALVGGESKPDSGGHLSP